MKRSNWLSRTWCTFGAIGLSLTSGCGEEPAYHTSQGWAVYMDSGIEVSKDRLSLAIDVLSAVVAETFSERLSVVRRTFVATDTVIEFRHSVGNVETLGEYVQGNRSIRIEAYPDSCDIRPMTLAHEVAHMVQDIRGDLLPDPLTWHTAPYFEISDQDCSSLLCRGYEALETLVCDKVLAREGRDPYVPKVW